MVEQRLDSVQQRHALHSFVDGYLLELAAVEARKALSVEPSDWSVYSLGVSADLLRGFERFKALGRMALS